MGPCARHQPGYAPGIVTVWPGPAARSAQRIEPGRPAWTCAGRGAQASGLSRSLIAGGLKRLQRLGLMTITGSAQKRRYVITGPHDRWFKLPCRAILRTGVLGPFTTFTMRTKHELHAMKLYLYLAAVRPNISESTMVSYETIHQRTGVPENDIRRAINVLNASGLLLNIDREYSRTLKVNEANKYYLTGHRDLVTRRPAQPAEAQEPAA